MSWTLEYDGTEDTFEGWSVSSPQRTQRSQSTGSFTFFIPGSITTAPFTHREEIIIRRDRTGTGPFASGSVFFRGIVTRISEAATGSGEGLVVEVADPWWFLENLVYEQAFKVFAGWVDSIPGGTPILDDASTSHVLLNKDIDGTIWGTRAQIEDVLDWAIAQGAPIAYTAATFPDMKIPLREEKDLTCAEAIRRQLAYMDAVTYWDYSVNPPALIIKRRSSLATVNVALTSCSAVQVIPRHDLKVPFVKVKFEKAYQDTGGTFIQHTTQVYPSPEPADKFGALLATVVLAPAQSVTAKQAVEVGDLDPTDVNFWKEVKKELNDTNLYADLAVIGGTTSVLDAGDNPVSLTNYLKDGQIADWMAVNYAPVIVSAEVSYKVKENMGGTAVTLGETRRKRVTVRLIATDATTQVYSESATTDPGEDPAEFASLAQNIYTDLNALNHDGSFTMVESECSGTVTMGSKVSFTGGPTPWASLAAPVQSISEDLFLGRTTVEIGVNKHLSVGSLVELLRVNRTRFYSRFAARDSGSYGRANDITLPGTGKEQNTTEAESIKEVASVSGKDGSSKTPQIKLTAKDGASLPELALQRLGTTGALDGTAGQIRVKLRSVTDINALN